MKTIPYTAPMSAAAKFVTLVQYVPVVAIGIAAAILLHRISVDGLFGASGARLPLAIAGTSAWLYAGFAATARHPVRVVAHLGFGIALFIAALLTMDAPAATLAPWFLAQAVWVLAHRHDIDQPTFVLGWAAFAATFAVALAV